MLYEDRGRGGLWFVCEQCGVLFRVPPSRALDSRGKYCDPRCAGDANIVPVRERFWRYAIDHGPDACWEWRGATNPKGYGVFNGGTGRNNGATSVASRVSWELHRGAIPPGLCVLHHCDNPPCTNPAHLWLGTKAQNNAEMWRKGRGKVPEPHRVHGERHHNARLSDADIATIRRLYASGRVSQNALAAQYRTPQSYISRLVNGKSRSHQTPPWPGRGR